MIIRKILSKYITKYPQLLTQLCQYGINTIASSKFLTVKMDKIGEDAYQFNFPNIEDATKKSVQFNANANSTVKELLSNIKEKFQSLDQLKVYNYDQVEIAQLTQLDHLQGQNFIIVDKQQRAFKVLNSDKPPIERYDHLYNYTNSIDMSFLERKIILNYIKRFDQISKMKIGSRIFSDHTKLTQMIDKKVIIDMLIESLPLTKNVQTENEIELYAQYQELKQKIAVLKEKQEQLMQIAHKQEKRKMIMGLMVVIGQFIYCGVGVYSIYSWDIIEPTIYFQNLAASVFLSSQFFKFQDDYNNNTFLEYRKQKAFERLCQQNNFNSQLLKQLESDLQMIEKKIKSNILINF